MNSFQQFQTLGRKQLAIQEGLEMLRTIQVDLVKTRSSANAWGNVAILANATLIPLNIIVNAFELKAAGSVYQMFVHTLYKEFGKSGTRASGHGKTLLATLKQVVVDELKRKSLKQFIPGVNIIVGMSEDSLALMQAAATVSEGGREMNGLAVQVDQKIRALARQLTALGIQRAEVLDRLQKQSRTA